jgi:hypothetical protein
VLVDGGKITESGTHDELVAAGGRYADLWHTFSGHDDESITAPRGPGDAGRPSVMLES